uniref:Uncharacterized protein n=1 Tax=Sphaerodactylus townsendi TaxID=933632 RepID=A0ACB8FX30_9SAUR
MRSSSLVAARESTSGGGGGSNSGASDVHRLHFPCQQGLMGIVVHEHLKCQSWTPLIYMEVSSLPPSKHASQPTLIQPQSPSSRILCKLFLDFLPFNDKTLHLPFPSNTSRW